MPKLNLLRLPPYTTTFFALIAVVILGTALASMLPDSGIPWPLIVPPLVLLPLRDFLRNPAREKRRHHLQPAGAETAGLQDVLSEFSQQAGAHTPQLLAGKSGTPLFAFGTFRRAFVAVDAETAQSLAEDLTHGDDRKGTWVRTLLAHELAHWINGDTRRLALARSLLVVTALFALVSLWFAVASVSIVILIGPEIVQRQFWVDLAATVPWPGLDLTWVHDQLYALNPEAFQRFAAPEQAGELWRLTFGFLINVFMPILMAVSILYLFFWRKLLRVREFYADARAAELMGDAASLRRAVALYQTIASMKPRPTGLWPRVQARLSSAVDSLPRPGLLATHPSWQERKASLEDPLKVFGRPWQIAAWTGVAVLLLELILSSSLSFLLFSQPGPYLPLVTACIIFSLWLLPHTCAGRSPGTLARYAIQIVVVFILIKLTLNLLDALFLGLAVVLGYSDTVGGMVNEYLRQRLGPLAAGAGDLLTLAELFEWHTARPISYYLLFGLPLILLVLLADTWLRRRSLTWYVLGERVRRVWWASLAALIACMALLFIPTGNRLFFPTFYAPFSAAGVAGLALGLLAGVAVAAGFLVYHRRLAGRCPGCEQSIPGPFVLGRACPHCHTLLHSWLIARY